MKERIQKMEISGNAPFSRAALLNDAAIKDES
jgi:hypothetical protein